MLAAQINIGIYGVIAYTSWLLVLIALRYKTIGLSLIAPAQQRMDFNNSHFIRLVSIDAPEVGKEDCYKVLYSKAPTLLFRKSGFQKSLGRICSLRRN